MKEILAGKYAMRAQLTDSTRLVRRECVAFHVRRRRSNGLNDVFIARTAAQVAGNCYPDFIRARGVVLLQKGICRHQEARGAEATLKRMVLPESLLQGVKAAVSRERLHGCDLRLISLHGEHQARTDRSSVYQNRAGAANAVLATDMGAREPELFPEKINQGQSSLSHFFVLLAVHL